MWPIPRARRARGCRHEKVLRSSWALINGLVTPGQARSHKATDEDLLAGIPSFELFRRQLHEPEILTFDEVLARAEWALDLAERASDK